MSDRKQDTDMIGRKIKTKLILLTPIFIILAHHCAMLPHEYAHSFMAWLLGDKINPLALNYGGTSWLNLLLLADMDENVAYQSILTAGHSYHVAFIAFAGIGIANSLMYIFSLSLLSKQAVIRRPAILYFIFLFNLMNVGNFFAYIPIRTLTTHGDVINFVNGLSISAWWVYIIGGYIVAFIIWYFFTRTMLHAFKTLNLSSVTSKLNLTVLCVLILFGFYGGLPGISGSYGEISYFLSATSLLAIPGIILMLWPTRGWIWLNQR